MTSRSSPSWLSSVMARTGTAACCCYRNETVDGSSCELLDEGLVEEKFRQAQMAMLKDSRPDADEERAITSDDDDDDDDDQTQATEASSSTSDVASPPPPLSRTVDIRELVDDPLYTGKHIRLPDGRILSYSESGDLNGFPVIFHIGLMGSSRAAVFYHSMAFSRSLRIIMLDYPGTGESTFQNNRSIGKSWPQDAKVAINHILGSGSRMFGVLGHSMGGPHALSLLQDEELANRISAVVLASPWLPFDDHPVIRAARSLPTFVQNEVIPFTVTSVSALSLQVASSWRQRSNKKNVYFAQKVQEYGSRQGQHGNQEMVRLAIREPLVLPFQSKVPIDVFCGSNDGLVPPYICERLADALVSRGCPYTTYTTLQGADHNSVVMHGDHLAALLNTFSYANQ